MRQQHCTHNDGRHRRHVDVARGAGAAEVVLVGQRPRAVGGLARPLELEGEAPRVLEPPVAARRRQSRRHRGLTFLTRTGGVTEIPLWFYSFHPRLVSS
jgi:hypothetical protein